jgi:hypothetical protein
MHQRHLCGIKQCEFPTVEVSMKNGPPMAGRLLSGCAIARRINQT